MNLKIQNKDEIDAFLRSASQGSTAIKGPPPRGATYDDGDLIEGLVNVGWRNDATGEVVRVEYLGECSFHTIE